jgi:hypothetical protein
LRPSRAFSVSVLPLAAPAWEIEIVAMSKLTASPFRPAVAR